MPTVEFFFDFDCPWSYLACGRLRETALRTGAEIRWRPFEPARLAAPLATRAGRLSADAARANWQLADLEAWARFCDVPLQLPVDWPQPATAALRGAVLAAGAGGAMAYVAAVFRARFADGRNIGDVTVLQNAAAAAGLDAAAFARALRDEQTLATLAANAAELRSRGGFRSATLFVGEQMFCGNSRMPLVEFALAQASDRRLVMPGQHG
jgi:2-hydroxychromene-2-carboxylate isomerase